MSEVSESRCSECDQIKPITDFYLQSKNPNSRVFGRPWKKCKACVAEQRRQQREADPETWRNRAVDAKLRHLYGIGRDDYEALLRKQRGCCAICGEPPAERRRLHVDHHHGNSAIRGLLCGNCNRGLGYLCDNPEIVLRAADYVAGAVRD
ncbi:endonuclease VII domain-containing protein [Streptomyces noursei]|uniref:endonuclease VII domain-containing protein n=1 Tax=Streptomyces noursei TaxID=1971 RepID=UPI0035E0824A